MDKEKDNIRKLVLEIKEMAEETNQEELSAKAASVAAAINANLGNVSNQLNLLLSQIHKTSTEMQEKIQRLDDGGSANSEMDKTDDSK